MVRGSDAASLDTAALDMLRGAVMPVPPDAGREPRGLTVSLRYRLE